MDGCKGNIIKRRLIKARQRRDLEVEELSIRCGIDVQLLRDFEADIREPSLSEIRKIATTLGVSVDYLMGIHEYPTGGSVLDPIVLLFNRLDKEDRINMRHLLEATVAAKTTSKTTLSQILVNVFQENNNQPMSVQQLAMATQGKCTHGEFQMQFFIGMISLKRYIEGSIGFEVTSAILYKTRQSVHNP